MKYEDKRYIDDFLNGNELNRKLYQVLLFLQDNTLARIENGKITFTGKGREGESKKYLYRGFMKFFYVREQEVSDENQA